MNRRKILRILMGIASLLIILGVVLMVRMCARAENPNVIVIHLEEDEVEGIKFEHLCLIPGETCEYRVSVHSDMAKQCDLQFDFVETEEDTLKHYAYVRIESGGEVVYDKLLAEAFEDEAICAVADFRENKNTEFTIVYYLPIEVGNEAENAEAVFELLISARNE